MKLKLVIPQIALVSLALSTAAHADTPRRASADNKAIAAAYSSLGFIAMNEKDLAHSGALHMSKTFADQATACSAEAKRRLDGGEAATTVVKVTAFAAGPREVKLGDVESTVCAPLAAKAKTWDDAVKAAHAGLGDAVAAPYKAVGIGGDKLAFLVSQKGDSDFYGVGGTLLKTPDAIKSASVLFILSGGGTDQKWTLYRKQFNGDALAGSSQQDYLLRPGAAAFK